MGILLPILVGLIYLTFFFHNKGFLLGAAHEAVSAQSLHRDDDSGYQIQKAAASLTKGRLLASGAVETGASAGKKEAKVTYRAAMRIPSMSAEMFAGGVTVRADCALSMQKPSERIRKIRGLMKAVGKGES